MGFPMQLLADYSSSCACQSRHGQQGMMQAGLTAQWLCPPMKERSCHFCDVQSNGRRLHGLSEQGRTCLKKSSG